MSRTLRLMEEADLPQVEEMVKAALAPRAAACGIDWQHDDVRLVLTVETDVPAAEVGEMHRKVVIPLLAALEAEFGEFSFEMRALCTCGAAATPILDNPGHDMCLCGECLDREIDGRRDGPQYTCPVCEIGFDDSGWSVRCSANISDNESESGAEMDIGTMRRDADVNRWDCCSRGCALKQFRKWLLKVESHPVAREASMKRDGGS